MSIDEGRYRKGALGIRRTKLEVGDDVGLTNPEGEPLEACRGTNGLAMSGNRRRTFRPETPHSADSRFPPD